MNYYRKPINKVVDDVKLKMQLGALTLKISENNDKIDDLLKVDKNIKKDIVYINSKTSFNIDEINNIKNDMSIKIKSDVFKKICNSNEVS